jgi:hypothetical protein
MFDLYGHVNNLDMDKFKRRLQVEKWQRLHPSFMLETNCPRPMRCDHRWLPTAVAPPVPAC